jgi:hypothetical protein
VTNSRRGWRSELERVPARVDAPGGRRSVVTAQAHPASHLLNHADALEGAGAGDTSRLHNWLNLDPAFSLVGRFVGLMAPAIRSAPQRSRSS